MTSTSEQQFKMSKRFYQFTIPVFLVSVITGILIVQYFFNYAPLNDLSKQLNTSASLITAISIIYATVILTMSNIRTLSQRRSKKEVFKSSIYLAVLAFYLILGLADPKMTSSQMFLNVYTPLMGMLGSAIWLNSQVGFIWSAVYSLSFIRSYEVAALLVAALFTAFQKTTLLVAIWPPFNTITTWIYNVPDRGARTAAVAAAGVSAIILGVRAIVGKEPGLVEMEIK